MDIELKTAVVLSRMVSKDDIRGAENLLTAIAQDHGDDQVLSVVGKMPSADILAIIREFDAGSPSILHSLITPKQFSRMILIERQYGQQKSVATSHAHGMISAIVFGENIHPNIAPADFLREMCSSEEGMKEFMRFVLSNGGTQDDEEHRHMQIVHFMKFGTFDLESREPDGPMENNDMSWRQAVQIVRNELPYELELFLIALEDYKNKLDIAPMASVLDTKNVLMASGKQEESAL